VSGSRLLVLDAVNVSSPGGMQLQLQLARSALQRRPPGSELLLLQADTEDAPAADPEVRLERFPPRRGWGAMARWFARELPGIARARGADAVYSLSGILSPALCREFATVNTINNMLPFTPEQIRYFPFWSPDRQRFYLLRFAYVWSSKRADALVVPSRFALTAMAPYAGNLAGKAFVAMNPVPERVRVRPEDPPAHPHGGRPFFFYLSVVFWYKNHLTLIEGYRRALAAEPDLPDLLMAGPPTETAYVRQIEAAIARAGTEKIRYLGRVDQALIPGYLHHATINVFPSLCETNSFVQGEILGAGGVMACSNLGPMPEIAGGAAELFDPRDPDAIAATLRTLWKDERRQRELREKALARAATFTWDACGDALWQAVSYARESFAARRRA